MAGEAIELRDHGRIIDLPLANVVIEFTCTRCHLDASGHLFEGQAAAKAFGKCPRCKKPMVASKVSLDFDKVISVLKKQGTVQIIWN